MLCKEATIHICVEHMLASATDEVRSRFSAGDEENFAYEMGVNLGAVLAKLFVDDGDELAECMDGLMAYLGSMAPAEAEE